MGLMVIKKDQIADISITSDESTVGHFTPVIGLEYGVSVDYDRKTQEIYWVETKAEGQDNGTLYKTSLGGGDKIDFFAEVDSGLVGAPYCIAFDWIGRNMYIGNIAASQISFVRVEGKTQYRMLVLDSRGDNKNLETGVSEPT